MWATYRSCLSFCSRLCGLSCTCHSLPTLYLTLRLILSKALQVRILNVTIPTLNRALTKFRYIVITLPMSQQLTRLICTGGSYKGIITGKMYFDLISYITLEQCMQLSGSACSLDIKIRNLSHFGLGFVQSGWLLSAKGSSLPCRFWTVTEFDIAPNSRLGECGPLTTNVRKKERLRRITRCSRRFT